MNEALWVVAILLVAVGIAGTVIPALPGTPLVFAGLLLAAWIDGFRKVGPFPLIVLAFLTLLSFAVDLLATALGAQRVGASRTALAGAVLGTFVGIFFGIPGFILGPFVGALAGELIARRDLPQAGRVGLATWLGLLLGSLVKLALTLTMIAVFATAYVL